MRELKKKPDAEILRDVREELGWDTNVEADHLRATVSEGVVTLTGAVGSWTARQAAQEAVRRISDVLDVVTDIVVIPKAADARQDTEIAHAVRHALEWHARVPHERIRTTVSAGVVTLEGDVDYWSQFDDVSKCVHDLIGVREVRNLIVVRGKKEPSVHELRARIEQALVRHAAHAAAHVELEVEPGKVTIRGHVPTSSERQIVEGTVRGTPGVSAIQSELRVG